MEKELSQKEIYVSHAENFKKAYERAVKQNWNVGGYCATQLMALSNGYQALANGSENLRFTVKKHETTQGIWDNFLDKWTDGSFSYNEEGVQKLCDRMNVESDIEIL